MTGAASDHHLDATSRACSVGTQQSPVDIGSDTIRAQLAPLKMTSAKSAADWLLLTDSIQVAEADIAGFARLYP